MERLLIAAPMSDTRQTSREMITDKGPVTLRSFCGPDEILAFEFDDSFTRFAQYDPIISSKKSLAQKAQEPDANVTLAFLPGKSAIIGFAVLAYPDPDERWVRVGEKVMMEVRGIEVSRPWRGRGLAGALVELLIDHPLAEDRIIYMVGYSWTWDLEGMPAMKYRDMMIRLFSHFGFQVFQTNEPNVMMHPENLFMARIGENIAEETVRRFKMVRFNMD